MANKAKELLKEGKLSLGGWESLNNAAAGEVMARAGFDWVACDIEHGTHSVQDYAYFATAVRSQGSVPLARIFDKSMLSIRRILDAGALGIIVPMIRTAQDAREVVSAASFRSASAGDSVHIVAKVPCSSFTFSSSTVTPLLAPLMPAYSRSA